MAKHVLADQLASRVTLIDRLQTLLLEENSQVVREICKELRFDVSDLRPKSRDSFGAVNVPTDIKDMRFEHFEERRAAKLLTIANEVLLRHPSNSQISAIAYLESDATAWSLVSAEICALEDVRRSESDAEQLCRSLW